MRQFVKVSQYIAREKLFFQTNYLSIMGKFCSS